MRASPARSRHRVAPSRPPACRRRGNRTSLPPAARGFEVGVDFHVHLLPAFLDPGFSCAPRPTASGRRGTCAGAGTVLLPRRLHFLLAAVARVVGGGVVVQAIGEEFDHGAAFALARARSRGASPPAPRPGRCRPPAGRQRPPARLSAPASARSVLRLRGTEIAQPLLITHSTSGSFVRAGGIHRGVEIGLGRTAVAAAGDREAVLLAQLSLSAAPAAIEALGRDRHAPRVVVARHLEVVAALVAASTSARRAA